MSDLTPETYQAVLSEVGAMLGRLAAWMIDAGVDAPPSVVQDVIDTLARIELLAGEE